MNRPMNRRRQNLRQACLVAFSLAAAASVSGCAESAVPVLRDGDFPRPYMQFSVIVGRANGSLGEAQSRANAICAEVLQSAVMYIAADVGEDRTQYHFRCR